MSDEKKDSKEPDPMQDLKNGIGLLFRAARTAAHKLPTDKFEETIKASVAHVEKVVEKLPADQVEGALKDSMRELARAFESVAHTIEKEIVRDKPKSEPPKEAPKDDTK